MNLKVVYQNPNPNGSNIALIEHVSRYLTKNRELHIWKLDQQLSDAPHIIFAVGQWVLVEMQEPDPNEPPRRDRHFVGDQTDNPQDMAGNPADRRSTQSSRRPNTTSSSRRRSDLTDLAFPTPLAVEQSRAASVQFAIDNRTIPWSEAHMKAVLDYEQAVKSEYGPDAVLQLPWNCIPRGTDTDEQ